MKTRTVVLAAAPLFLVCMPPNGAARQNAATPAQELKVNIDTQPTARPVSPYEYGMFIEHIGQLIYRSLWSEMLDDRKFYFPIKPEEPPAVRAGPGRPLPRHATAQVASGRSGRSVVMDKDEPFVGEQSPRIQLDASTPHGIRQSGFALVKGKKYTGHIWLRATPGAKVKVALVWGDGANDRQTVALPGGRRTHTKNYPSASPPAPTPTPVRSRSRARARATSTSAPSRSCPPTTSKVSARK